MNSKIIHERRMAKFRRAGLYLVTSQALSRGRPTERIVKEALAGGVRLIQLREKEMPFPRLFRLAEKIRAMTRAAGALLIINDRLDLALAVQADGVHLGQDDLPVCRARKIAPDLIIGASTHSLKEALAAQRAGASYVNIGPIFPTRTKKWDKPFLGIAKMKRIAAKIKIPFTVMGGIKAEHIPELLGTGAGPIALVTAVTAAEKPRRAAGRMLALIRAGKQTGASIGRIG
ncbi:MAG: thiamine phosphate synthase [Kiritimatiellae bacterium]|nr:thiamine phosphate synthase [Kiritimatiellia bacterium]